jgi:hypothetical protein
VTADSSRQSRVMVVEGNTQTSVSPIVPNRTCVSEFRSRLMAQTPTTILTTWNHLRRSRIVFLIMNTEVRQVRPAFIRCYPYLNLRAKASPILVTLK